MTPRSAAVPLAGLVIIALKLVMAAHVATRRTCGPHTSPVRHESAACRVSRRLEEVTVNPFDVRIHAIRRRKDRRRQFEVRWHAAGRDRSRSFITRGLADGYRAELVRAARRGLDFSPATGEPARWAGPGAAAVTWLEHATAYAAMKWPHLAAHSRASIADALATITPALATTSKGRPAPAVLRAALYRHAFNPAAPAPRPCQPAATALDWARRHSPPLTDLADPRVARQALEQLTLRLDGTRAAANTITRKRAVFHDALGYATELGLLETNPLDRVRWKPPKAATAIDPRIIASPAQVRLILTEVARTRPELAAFFGCLYYAALRPEEAVALRAADCHLPPAGWGQLTISGTAPRTGSAWTDSGTPHERRGLKQRPEGEIRVVPIPPDLVTLLRRHIRDHGTAPGGRLFRSPRGGILRETTYGRIWHRARAKALGPELAAAPLGRRPYDLRHAALSLWLASGTPPAEIAARAGHSPRVLLTIYAHTIPGHDQAANHAIEHGLASPAPGHQAAGPPPGPPPAHKNPSPLGPGPSARRPRRVRNQPQPAGPSRTRKHH